MSFKVDDDYNTVAARIVEFRAKYPEGSLQPANLAEPYRLETINGNQCVVVVAAAYRTPDDQRPGVGMAYEPVPGATPFTRGSELQNAETAAWGRAIVAALAADTNKGVASAEEVRNRGAERDARTRRQGPPDWQARFEDAKGDPEKLQSLRVMARQAGAPDDWPVFKLIDQELAALTPLEGTVQ